MVALSPPKGVVFDWDNTLVDTWPIIYAALVKTFEAFDMAPWPLERVKSSVKKSMRDSFPDVFGEDWQRAADIYQQSYRSAALTDLAPLNGAEDILKALQAAHIPMFVVSNKRGDNLRIEIAHLGWGHYFRAQIGAGDAANDKPHPDHAWLALKPSGHQSAEGFWFIGDSDADLECAANINCAAILYGEHATTMAGYKDASLNGHAYAAHVMNHSELLNLIGRHT